MTPHAIGPAVLSHRDVPLLVPAVRCACGCALVVAIEPGSAPVLAPGGFPVSSGQAPRAWCTACWPAARRNRVQPEESAVSKQLMDVKAAGMDAAKFHKWTRQFRAKKAELDRVRGEYQNLRKQAKDDGMDMVALKMATQFGNLDQDEAEATARHLREYLHWDSNGQSSLFASEAAEPIVPASPDTARAIALDKIAQTGFEHGKAGGSLDDMKYAPGSDEANAWAVGVQNGQAQAKPAKEGGAKKASTRKARDLSPAAAAARVEVSGATAH